MLEGFPSNLPTIKNVVNVGTFSGVKEWENTPADERFNLVMKAKASEKNFRLQKRFSGALKLLGEGFMSGEKFMVSSWQERGQPILVGVFDSICPNIASFKKLSQFKPTYGKASPP